MSRGGGGNGCGVWGRRVGASPGNGGPIGSSMPRSLLSRFRLFDMKFEVVRVYPPARRQPALALERVVG